MMERKKLRRRMIITHWKSREEEVSKDTQDEGSAGPPDRLSLPERRNRKQEVGSFSLQCYDVSRVYNRPSGNNSNVWPTQTRDLSQSDALTLQNTTKQARRVYKSQGKPAEHSEGRGEGSFKGSIVT